VTGELICCKNNCIHYEFTEPNGLRRALYSPALCPICWQGVQQAIRTMADIKRSEDYRMITCTFIYGNEKLGEIARYKAGRPEFKHGFVHIVIMDDGQMRELSYSCNLGWCLEPNEIITAKWKDNFGLQNWVRLEPHGSDEHWVSNALFFCPRRESCPS
jgi:hypothetical protein